MPLLPGRPARRQAAVRADRQVRRRYGNEYFLFGAPELAPARPRRDQGTKPAAACPLPARQLPITAPPGTSAATIRRTPAEPAGRRDAVRRPADRRQAGDASSCRRSPSSFTASWPKFGSPGRQVLRAPRQRRAVRQRHHQPGAEHRPDRRARRHVRLQRQRRQRVPERHRHDRPARLAASASAPTRSSTSTSRSRSTTSWSASPTIDFKHYPDGIGGERRRRHHGRLHDQHRRSTSRRSCGSARCRSSSGRSLETRSRRRSASRRCTRA